MFLARRLVPTVLLAVPVLLAACAEAGNPPLLGPDPDLPISMAIVSGDGQAGPAGAELPDPLVVRVTAPAGSGGGAGGNAGNGAELPVAGQIVNFVVVQGGGSVFAGTAITNRQGLAQDWWTLGEPGDQRLEVRAVDPATGEKLVFAAFQAVATGDGGDGGDGGALDDDGDGFTEDQGDCDDGNASVHPGADDPPGDGVDSDCDGLDGASGDVIFVAPASLGGTDAPGCGLATGFPCATVQNGIDRAVAEGRSAVLVALGIYQESVTLADGVSLHGGYDAADGWSWDGSDKGAEIRGVEGAAADPVLAVLADGITSPTVVANLTIVGPDATTRLPTGQGKSAYGVVVAASSTNLVLRGNVIQSGDGMSGAPGSPGQDASGPSAGMNGATGGSAGLLSGCDATTSGPGGNAGTNPAGANLDGGRGGDGGTMDSSCPFDLSATPGEPGTDAEAVPPGFGVGGSGGGTCMGGLPGLDGRPGDAGLPGTGAPGGGVLVSDFWFGRSGTNGGPGRNGTGGGGGGGSGGCDSGSPDTFGAGGGGGGAGGLGAPAGGGGGAGGGGSFAVYLIASGPTIENNTIRPGNGGNGGNGGDRGRGQPGGAGGSGGLAAGLTGAGGTGGDGGTGGGSGGGGGGAGGASVGVYLTQGSVLVLSGNDFQIAASVPGSGGASREPGEDGADGILQPTATHGS